MKELLSFVSKPVRYLGGEVNSIKKDPSQVKLKFCLAFPDVYEVGMSHLGIHILYHILNNRKEILCERVFAPWVDMEKVLRDKKGVLCSLESSLPLAQFDILGFSLQYELSFTNLLNMLDLSHIPFLSRERDERFPLLIAGGPAVFNPEPISDFFDAIVIGDGEEVVLEICDLVLQWKEARGRKDELLKALSQLEGVYVPDLYSKNKRVRKRTLPDIDQAPFPNCPIVPYMRLIHDRLNVEIARGCKRGCRFCEAGFIYRPYRERSLKRIEEILIHSLKKTGYEEVSLLSLSAGDYSGIVHLLSNLMGRFESQKVALSFPSLRIDSIVGQLAQEVKRVRKTGFTIAPEAGTERLRRVINKEMDERVLFEGITQLFEKGWRNLKLYFMIGLPTEKEEDLKGLVHLAKKISLLAERMKIHPNLNVSVSTFVPKPHTPFQWAPQISLNEMKEKLQFLKEELKRNRLRLKWQDPHLSYLEGIFSKGDRGLSQVLIKAHGLGCRFDGWSDQFRYHLWEQAFAEVGRDMDSFTRTKSFQEDLPWSFIDTGIKPTFLWEEFQRGLAEEVSPSCLGKDCRLCGICDGETLQLKEYPPSLANVQEGVKRGEVKRKRLLKKKIRLRFKKGGESRYISHLELASLFHRSAKRAGLPLCYSEGFHPMPRIIFANALSVGIESLSEIVDIELEGGISPSEAMEKLNQTLPSDIKIYEASEVPLNFPSSHLIQRSVYWVPLDHVLPKEEAIFRIQKALERSELKIHQERKGKKRSIDLLPLIEKMEVKEGRADTKEGSNWGVELVFRSSQRRRAKPIEILEAVLGLKGEPLYQLKVIKVE